jgi:hypothetical protein
MYKLEPLALEAQPVDLITETAWPIDRKEFEDKLRSGAIEGCHLPDGLPDDPWASPAPAGSWRRYRLTYLWDATLPTLGVISCNPSRATRTQLDDTLELTVNQAAIWRFGGIDQGNLDPVFESNSQRLAATADLDDRDNRTALERILENGTVWLAWGNKPSRLTGDLALAWERAEQHVLAAAHRRQALALKLVVAKLNKGKPDRAPRHASPRRFPPKAPRTVQTDSKPVRVVRAGRT